MTCIGWRWPGNPIKVCMRLMLWKSNKEKHSKKADERMDTTSWMIFPECALKMNLIFYKKQFVVVVFAPFVCLLKSALKRNDKYKVCVRLFLLCFMQTFLFVFLFDHPCRDSKHFRSFSLFQLFTNSQYWTFEFLCIRPSPINIVSGKWDGKVHKGRIVG